MGVIEVKNLVKEFKVKRGKVRALDELSLTSIKGRSTDFWVLMGRVRVLPLKLLWISFVQIVAVQNI